MRPSPCQFLRKLQGDNNNNINNNNKNNNNNNNIIIIIIINNNNNNNNNIDFFFARHTKPAGLKIVKLDILLPNKIGHGGGKTLRLWESVVESYCIASLE